MKNKTVNATIWSLLDTYSGYALKLLFAIAITRILTPRDYGLVAYMGLFMGIAAWLSDWGFGTALIQKKDTTDIDFSTGFVFNCVISIFFFVLYFISAPNIAAYFKEPELKNIMRVTSFSLVLSSLSYVQSIKLMKSIQYKKLTKVNLLSSILSGILGLSLALTGYNYWALILQTLSGNLIRTLGLIYFVRWIPKIKFSWTSFKEQFHFGSRVFVAGLLESIFREIHSLVIGKIYKTDALGNFSRGKKFYDLFIVQTGIAFNKVLYPTMVNINDEKGKHKKMYNKAYVLLFFVMAPLSMFLILLSKPIVEVLLTDKWIEAVPFMKLYFFAGFIFMLTYFNSTTILTSNKPNAYLTLEIIQKVFFGLALFFTYNYGISSIIIGWLIACYIHYFISEFMMYKLDFFNSSKKYQTMMQVLICMIPSYMVFIVSKLCIERQLWLLLFNAFFQPFIYFLCMRLSGFSVYKDFVKLVIPYLPEFLQKGNRDTVSLE